MGYASDNSNASMRKWLVLFFLVSIILHLVGVFYPFIFQSSLSDENPNSPNINKDLSFIDLFLNNLYATLTIALFGFFTFGLYSILMTFLNGYILGVYLYHVINHTHISTKTIIMGTFPHFLEFVSIWMSCSLGLLSTVFFIRLVKGENMFFNHDIAFLLKFLGVILCFVFIAAYLEIHISVPAALRGIE